MTSTYRGRRDCRLIHSPPLQNHLHRAGRRPSAGRARGDRARSRPGLARTPQHARRDASISNSPRATVLHRDARPRTARILPRGSANPINLWSRNKLQGAESGCAHDELPEATAHACFMSAVDIQLQIQNLTAERALASIERLDEDVDYMADLEDELATMRHAYAMAAVTEIATLRGSLSGRRAG